MGQIKRIRKKYQTPSHPWQKDRILEEKELTREYGLKNKKEIWKYSAKLKSARNQVKKIIANTRLEQSKKEKEQLINKLLKYDIISKNSDLDDILDLKVKDFLERRLQTIIFKKGLARSINQSRQFITHGHILIEGQKITSPSYMVSKNEEKKVEFIQTSALAKADHPERTIKEILDKARKEKIIKERSEKKETLKKEEVKKDDSKEKKEKTSKEEVKEKKKEEIKK